MRNHAWALILVLLCSCHLPVSAASNWWGGIDLGLSDFSFRGQSDTAPVLGIKLGYDWNSYLYSYVSIHQSDDLDIRDVPRIEVNFVEISGVQIQGDYQDIAMGFGGKWSFDDFSLVAEIGLTQQSLQATAVVPGFGENSISDDEIAFFYAGGVNFAINHRLFVSGRIRYNELFSDSDVMGTMLGLNYRF